MTREPSANPPRRPKAEAPPDEALPATPQGLAAIAGGLQDWAEFPAVVQEICASRHRARDRAAPEFEPDADDW